MQSGREGEHALYRPPTSLTQHVGWTAVQVGRQGALELVLFRRLAAGAIRPFVGIPGGTVTGLGDTVADAVDVSQYAQRRSTPGVRVRVRGWLQTVGVVPQVL